MLQDRKILKRIRNEDTDDLMQEFHGKCADDVDMFKNVRCLKTGADEHDPYYIHKMNCKSINGEQSYVFKSSKLAGEIALKMDRNLDVGWNNPLNEEYAYLDGMHSCVHGYKTLTL